jgi:hypothetical protein
MPLFTGGFPAFLGKLIKTIHIKWTQKPIKATIVMKNMSGVGTQSMVTCWMLLILFQKSSKWHIYFDFTFDIMVVFPKTSYIEPT